MKLKMVIALGLFLMSFSVMSETYTAKKEYRVSNLAWNISAQAACDLAKSWYPSATTDSPSPLINPTGCEYKNASGGTVGALALSNQLACPGGGTVSGTNCINATPCTTPQIRSDTTGMCGAPACAPPKFLNSFGVCGIPECPSYQVANETTGSCQTPPVCGSTETYQNSTNSCVLSPLNCPGHAHANASNDGCIPDAPLACPSGQHDDGTYTCVANDPEKCGKNQASGYINGTKTCISTPPMDTLQQEAADRAAAGTAIANSNANPTDAGLANIANNQIGAAQVNGVGMSNDLLRSIAASENEANNREEGKQAMPGGDSCNEPPACTGDAIQCAILIETHKQNCRTIPDPTLSDDEIGGNVAKINKTFTDGMPADMGISAFDSQQYVSTSFFNLSGSSCQAIPFTFRTMNYQFDPCQKLAPFRNLMGWFFYMWTAISIVQLAREKS